MQFSPADYGIPVVILWIVWQILKEALAVFKGNGKGTVKPVEAQTLKDVEALLMAVAQFKDIVMARDSQGRPRVWFPSEPIERLSTKIDEALSNWRVYKDKFDRNHDNIKRQSELMSEIISELKALSKAIKESK